ncbi:MAG: EF-hand domain-containing protein [Gallionella sp.]
MNKAILGAAVFLFAQTSFAADTSASGVSATNPAAGKKQTVAEAFKEVDTNGDGGLSEEELAKAEKGKFAVIKANFKQMDANKDGKVTLEEASKWIAAQRYKFGK